MNIVPQSLVDRHSSCSLSAKGMRINTSRGRLRCYVQDNNFIVDLLDFRYVREQSVVNAFLCSNSLPTSYDFTFWFIRIARFGQHFKNLPQLGVGCFGDKIQQTRLRFQILQRHQRVNSKVNEKKLNNCKKLQVSLIYSQILPSETQKSAQKLEPNLKNQLSSRENQTRMVYPNPAQAKLLPYCLVCQEYGYSMTLFLLFLFYPLSFVVSHVAA